QDVFVHMSGLVDTIRENDVVTFDLQNGNKGVNAVNVKIA
ncbi:MAG: cold shock domain-containing protein, partial [Chryseobacterium sp.]|nr:cold shock domain-containing protein [Chryseobacterium sp.]